MRTAVPSERGVLADVVAFTTAAQGYLSARDPALVRAAAAEIAADTLGAPRLLRQYLYALADVLTG